MNIRGLYIRYVLVNLTRFSPGINSSSSKKNDNSWGEIGVF